MEVKVLRGTRRPVLGGTDASDQSEQEAEGKAEAGSVGGNPGRADAARLAFYHLSCAHGTCHGLSFSPILTTALIPSKVGTKGCMSSCFSRSL